MRSRKAVNDQVAEVARRRLELLSAELAAARGTAASALGPAADPPTDGAPAAGEVVAAAPEDTQELGRETTAPPPPGRHARRAVAPADRVGGWLHDRLPPTLQGRVGLGPTHLTVVALLVAAALAAAAWWVVRAEPGETTLLPTAGGPATSPVAVVPTPGSAPAGSSVAGSAVPGAASAGTAPPRTGASTRAPATPRIVVDVAGKVRHPGIARLPAGSRVVDAVKAAGGARKGVDLTSLNLARVLVDGEQIAVGIPPPEGVAASAVSAPEAGAVAGSPPRLVNLNTATQAELETLPGVGPVTAQAILTWRTENGAFTAVDELLEVSGIGEVTLSEVAPLVTV